jgi:O-acetyl-ADP-ribose deacetylase (regulator of RNase III)
VTTRGYRLPARFVIHVLGPVWYGAEGEAEALERAYANVVSAADLLALSSIALPSVSTGIFGYPVEQAAPIAVSAVAQGLSASQHVRSATFVLFDDATYDAFASAIGGFSAR